MNESAEVEDVLLESASGMLCPPQITHSFEEMRHGLDSSQDCGCAILRRYVHHLSSGYVGIA
jgi:hypothetical protein